MRPSVAVAVLIAGQWSYDPDRRPITPNPGGAPPGSTQHSAPLPDDVFVPRAAEVAAKLTLPPPPTPTRPPGPDDAARGTQEPTHFFEWRRLAWGNAVYDALGYMSGGIFYYTELRPVANQAAYTLPPAPTPGATYFIVR